MNSRFKTMVISAACAAALYCLSSATANFTDAAQQGQKPLTNADVIKMVKARLSESVIVATVQANPGKYDTSPDALIALQKAGVTPNEMNAMVAAAQAPKAGTSAPPANVSSGNPSAGAPGPRWQMPTVTALQNQSALPLPLEKTQLAETKTQPKSLSSLSGDSALTQAIDAGVSNAGYSAASQMNSAVGGSMVQQAGGIFSGALKSRQPSVTYVWGVPGPVSSNVLQMTLPKFVVNFTKAPGVNPDEFAPQIVRLTPAQNTCRLVGATRGKEDARSREVADWEIYSSFVEERVATTAEKQGPGQYVISPQSALYPGEYAVVLRPVSKSEKFSGGEVARGQGRGLVFSALWSFQVPVDAQ